MYPNHRTFSSRLRCEIRSLLKNDVMIDMKGDSRCKKAVGRECPLRWFTNEQKCYTNKIFFVCNISNIYSALKLNDLYFPLRIQTPVPFLLGTSIAGN